MIDQVENAAIMFEKRAVSLKIAAKLLGTSIDTIRRSIRAGRLKSFRINGPRGNLRVPLSEIEKFMRGEYTP